MIGFVLGLMVAGAALGSQRPQAAAIGCKGEALVRRVLAEQAELVAGKALRAFVRRQRIDSKTREGAVAIAEAFELDLVVRCTRGQGRRAAVLEMIDADGTVLSRRPLAALKKKKERQLLAAWIRAGVRDALAAGAGPLVASAAGVALEASGGLDAAADEETPAVEAERAAEKTPAIVGERATDETTAEVGGTKNETPAIDVDQKARGSRKPIAGASAEAEHDDELAKERATTEDEHATNMDGAGSAELRAAADVAARAGEQPSALLLLGASLREEQLSAELTLRTRLLDTSSLEAELTSGISRDRTYRFLFSAAYLFDILGVGIGPSLALGIDPGAPGNDRVARAGAVLLIPLITEALALRIEGGYRPILDPNLDAILAHGYAGRGSIEGSFEVGFSYALRAEHQAAADQQTLAFAALLGWRF